VLAGEAVRGGRIWRRVSWAGAVLVALSFGPWLYHLARSGEHPLLAIQEGKLEIKSEPRADAAAIAEVSAGDELSELDALPEWTKVELPNGMQGWARKSALFDLDR
jgi:SH3-like domain-containing protein